MKREGKIGIWFQQLRGPFLILSCALTAIGIATARAAGRTNWGHALLLLAGVVLAHVSVNLFNELSDFRTGIDAATVRTPFSGGSGLLQAGKTSPRSVAAAAYASGGAAALIGLHFCLASGWLILIFMIAGALAIRFYTTHLARWMLGEIAAGLTLGTFVVLGVHYALARSIGAAFVFIAIPPGIMTMLLLLLNEFPDIEADRRGGRRHLLIRFGKRKGALIYTACLAAAFAMIAAAPLLFPVPFTVWLALLPFPLGVAAAAIVLHTPDDPSRLVKALGLNVALVIGSDLLLAAGFIL